MTSDRVVLTALQFRYAFYLGCDRRISSQYAGLKDRGNCTEESAIWYDVMGAVGEEALCSLLGWHNPRTINSFKSPDAKHVQVRTTAKVTYGLKVKPDDRDDDIFVLVLGPFMEAVPTKPGEVVAACYVKGWMFGSEAKQQQWLKDPKDRKDPAYFVPQQFLRPLSEIPRTAMKACTAF